MLNRVDYVMVNVSDMGRSVAFYRDTLGLALRFESPGWSEFETGATTLALHLAPASGGAAATGGGPRAGTCSLGFSVADVDQTVAQLQARGARFIVAPPDQPEEGIRLAVCADPDGLAISFAARLGRPEDRGSPEQLQQAIQ
jgi:lactoylglutathione lyase